MCFDPVAAVFFIKMGQGIRISLRILYVFDSISSEIVWISKLHYFHEGLFYLNNSFHENRKNSISQLL